jgi:hypothetical protein
MDSYVFGENADIHVHVAAYVCMTILIKCLLNS